MGTKGHAKNARNQLESMLIAKRHGEEIDEEDIKYAYDEVDKALEEL